MVCCPVRFWPTVSPLGNKVGYNIAYDETAFVPLVPAIGESHPRYPAVAVFNSVF